MRNLILKMSISVDGFVSDLDGTNRWMFGGDPEAKAWSVEYLWTAGLHIMGSRTFRDMAAFWPTSTDMFAPPMNEIPKAVFSRQGSTILKDVSGAGNWGKAYVANGDLAEEITKLKAREGKPIIAHGGVGFARGLIARGLVDRFAFLVAPVALGKGHPLFCELAASMPLRPISSRAFPGGAMARIFQPA